MPEMPHAEYHRDPVLVGGGDNFARIEPPGWIISCDALRRGIDAVAEREECVAGHHRTRHHQPGVGRL